ncbi:MAG TPA: hypothetical protein VK826_04370 [Bacteroidia bacterium]|nr:hypothetical protein [Bacteroidia bacterium]
MKRILLAVVMVLIFVQIGAQEQKVDSIRYGKNTIFFELLGRGILYSVNYDRVMSNYPKHNWASRIGIGYEQTMMWRRFYVPLSVQYIFGTRHCLEIGAGVTLAFEDDLYTNESSYALDETLMFGIGYRFRSAKTGFFFKAEFLEYLPRYDHGIPFWGGLGIGYTFRQQTA